MRDWRSTVLLLLLGGATLGGCLILGSLDGYEVAPGTGGAGGGGATAGEGGTGATGGGGAGGCGEIVASECAVTGQEVKQLGGAGNIVVTDMDRIFDDGVVIVGLFSGTIQLGTEQVVAVDGTDGFVYQTDSNGDYRAHFVLPEADDNSDIFVDYDEPTDVVAVGGTYHESNLDCAGTSGFFARLLRFNPQAEVYESVYPNGFHCVEATGDVRAYGVAGQGDFSTSGFVNIAGSFTGTLGTETAEGVDAAVVSFEVDGAPGQPIIFGGAGDEIIRDIVNNNDNQLLVAGDFTEDLNVLVVQNGGDLPFDGTVSGERDLFVATVDGEPDFGNLVVTTMGQRGASHEAVSLSFDRTNPRAALLARMSGDLTVGTTTIADPGGAETALVLEFIAPNDDTATPLDYVGHRLLQAEVLRPTHITRTQDTAVLHVAGEALGPISVGEGDGVTVVPPSSCVEETFLLTLAAGVVSTAQRCGDGAQGVAGLTWRSPDGLAAVIGVPTGSTIDVGELITVEGSGDDAFLLLQD